MVILKYLLPIFFVIFSFAEILKIRILGAAGVGAIDLILSLILFVWLFLIKKRRNYLLLKPLLIFIGAAVFSLLINFTSFSQNQLFNSSLYLVRFILYAGIYFVVIDLGRKFNPKIIKYMFLSGFLILFFGFLQYFLYPSLKNLYYLGYDEHMYRLFGTFLDPNFIGIFFVLIFIFIFVLRDQVLLPKWKYFVWTFLVLDFIALILTFSRGALLMFVVSSIIYSILVKRWKIAAGVIVLFVLIFFVLSPLFYLENTNLLRFASTESRLESSKKALVIFEKKPMGVGFNTYRYAREKFGDPDRSIYGLSHSGAGVDNSFLQALVTTGFIGFAAYLYLLYKIFKLGFKDTGKNKLGLILIVSLGGLMVNALFINSLFYGFVMIWVWILAGLTENSLRE